VIILIIIFFCYYHSSPGTTLVTYSLTSRSNHGYDYFLVGYTIYLIQLYFIFHDMQLSGRY